LQLTAGTLPPSNPIARAYFRAMESPEESGPVSEPSEVPDAPAEATEAVGAVMDVLLEAGVVSGQSRALLGGAVEDAPRVTCIRTLIQFTAEHDHAAFLQRSAELAYLANTIVAGCSIQARPFTAAEASDAAAATCNLGLEQWPDAFLDGSLLPEDFLVKQDLVSVFQVGWTILYSQVCLFAAKRLIELLDDFRCDDSDTQSGLDVLHRDLIKHCQAGTPWRARDAMEVIAILDTPAWAALLGLIDECPVLHGVIAAAGRPGIRSISMSAFEFIGGNDQIAAVHTFLDGLPSTLSG
jgi:hypothetical protein